MTLDPELQRLPGKKGEVRYFVHVHANKPTKPVSDADGKRHIRYIEGLCRRMIVLKQVWWFDYSTVSQKPSNQKPDKGHCAYYTATARPGYLVVELRSKVPSGREKMHSKPLTDYLEKGKDSVISYIPMVYPAEAHRHFSSQEVLTLSSDRVDEIVVELADRGLRGDIIDPQVVAD